MAVNDEPLKTGPEVIDEMTKEPTLDAYFDRDPHTLTDDDLRQFIEIQRQRRALFIQKESEK